MKLKRDIYSPQNLLPKYRVRCGLVTAEVFLQRLGRV